LKDPEAVLKALRPPIEVEADFEALYALLSQLEPRSSTRASLKELEIAKS
jgi:hypothetical protein